jgi:MerR family transcriptional regulator/heat shock protein HspR
MERQARDFYLISMAAALLDMHPQTLRKYERLGLVRPQRMLGSMRVYTHVELDRLRLIKALVDEAGINLAGVRRLLSIADAARRLQPLVERRARRHGRTGNAELERALSELMRLLGVEKEKADAR